MSRVTNWRGGISLSVTTIRIREQHFEGKS